MIRPLRDMLVVRPLTRPGMIGKLHMPDTETLAVKTGVVCEVIAAGPKCVLAKAGSKVHLPGYGSHPAGAEIYHEGETIILIPEHAVNGVLDET